MAKKSFYLNSFVILTIDSILLSVSWYLANLLRFNFDIPESQFPVLIRLFPVILIIKVLVLYFFDLYRGMWRYTSLSDLLNILKAASVGSLLLVCLIAFTHGLEGFARSTFVIDWVLTVFLTGGYRVGIRLFFWIGFRDNLARIATESVFTLAKRGRTGAKRLLIIGAGDSGEKIFREIQDNARLKYNVVGFIDDDEEKVGKQIHGVTVLGTTRELQKISERMKADELLVAIPSATAAQMRTIFSLREATGLPSKTIPGIGELIDGKVTVKAIRDVAYNDLLGRPVVRLEEDRIGSYLENSRVLVTGGGGSIGSELCRQICRFRPERLVLYERAESALYEIGLELKGNFPYVHIISVLGDIRDRMQLSKTFEVHQPKAVFHAAAYKHVPMMELQPWKAVKNNIFGTRNVIDASNQYKVDRFVLVSTDKAVRPGSVMGACKRVGELLVQGQNGCGISKTKFMTVRFGNVVGSIGSVVPLFKKQIEKGGPVTVTHPEMTRFFMTIPEACQLILQAVAMGEGGEIFILDMGRPVKIVDMARDLIQLSGFEPDVDIKIEYVGLRPGEKLHEELITKGEGIVPTSHEKIMVLRPIWCDPNMLNGTIDALKDLAYEQNSAAIKKKIQEIVPEYQPAAA